MSLAAFVPANTQKARSTAIAAFKRMLEEENVSLDFVHASIRLDTSGKRLAATMDRFGFYLATNDGKKVPTLTCAYRTDLTKTRQDARQTLHEKEKGGLINKAPPCTEEDLQALIRYVYSTARVHADYQDAALACLMWHCFGRSSDLGYIQKQHVSISADGAFYLRLLRVKTSEEQGLTLIPDKEDFLTCPLRALAVALATQDSPCAALLNQLPELVSETSKDLDEGTPLHDLLAADPTSLEVAVVPTRIPAAVVDASSFVFSHALETTPPPTPTTIPAPIAIRERTKRGEDGVQAYVNRILKRVAEPAGDSSALTSHSFRRGGAQHANGDDHLAAQWIFDRGAWDMTKTNKAFAYITNTAREDRKVARVLSGWEADESPTILDITALDHASREQLERFQVLLFSSCTGLKNQQLNVSVKVLSVLTAYLVRYYPRLKELAPTAPIVMCVEECLASADIPVEDVLSWSVALNNEADQPVQEQEQKSHSCPAVDHLLAVIQQLITPNKALAARLTVVEAALLKPTSDQPVTGIEKEQVASDQEPKPKRRKKQTTNLCTTWYEWYTRVPRVWESSDRHKKSESRHIVAFMKLFLGEGFVLDTNCADYKDNVLDAGRRAEKMVLGYLKGKGIQAKGAGSVLRALRPLHKSGALDEHISSYKRLLAIGKIQDPAPATRYVSLGRHAMRHGSRVYPKSQLVEYTRSLFMLNIAETCSLRL